MLSLQRFSARPCGICWKQGASMLGSCATGYVQVLADTPRYCEGGVGRRISTGVKFALCKDRFKAHCSALVFWRRLSAAAVQHLYLMRKLGVRSRMSGDE